MEDCFEHKTVVVNGINMHVVEAGQGPVILFIHGFYGIHGGTKFLSWLNMVIVLSLLTYLALEIPQEVTGSSRWKQPLAEIEGVSKDDPSKYTSLQVVGDLVELLNTIAPKEEKVFVVGHDWGALIAWALCLFRPDKVKALVNLSVAFSPRNPKRKPLETLRAVCGEDSGSGTSSDNSKGGLDTSYASGMTQLDLVSPIVVRFQEPGEIEAEFAKIGTKKVLEKFLTYRNPGPLYFPKGKPFDDSPVILPSWLQEKEVDYIASKYEKAGFTGGVNYYRAIDLNWELTAAWTGAKVKVPVKFIVGDLDLIYNAPGVKDYVHKGGMKKDVPLLEEVVILENVGHFLQQEKPDEINKHIHDFFHGFSSST